MKNLNRNFQYKKYHYNKLVKLIRELGIYVYESPTKNPIELARAKCFGFKQNIRIGTNNNYYLRFIIAALAHELGHCLQVRRGGGMTMGEMLLYRLGTTANKQHRNKIIKEERVAWRLGFKFLRDNGIPVDKTMINNRRIFINSHLKNFQQMAKAK